MTETKSWIGCVLMKESGKLRCSLIHQSHFILVELMRKVHYSLQWVDQIQGISKSPSQESLTFQLWRPLIVQSGFLPYPLFFHVVSFAPLFLPLPLSHCPSPGPHFLLYIHAHLPLSKKHSLKLPSVLLEDVVLEIWSSLSSCSSLFLFALFTVSSIVISITRVTQFSKIEVIFLFGNAVGNHFRYISLFNKLKAHLSFVKTY